MRYLPTLLFVVTASLGAAAHASTVYKCSSHGQVAYQDSPCTRAQQQQIVQLAAEPPAAATSTAAKPDSESLPASIVVTTAATRSAATHVPLPPMYRCRRAVDGQLYLSSNGRPAPFLAPFGMLGAVQMPLAQVYGQPGGAGISAPEANRGRVSRGLVANHYVWVQDQCRPLSMPEICHALGRALEENSRKLQRAFKSDRPPLQARDAELRAQLSNC